MILIPVKSQENAKQRLAALLSARERLELAQAMLEDVLDAVAAVPDCPPVSLVTSDAHARGLAARFGYAVIEDTDNGGETAAIESATRICVERGIAWALVIPGDAPLVTPAEVRAVLDAAPERGSVLVTDHKHRGSNAVLRRPADLFPLRFGDDSYAPHLRASQATGLPAIELQLPGIALDLDRPEDVAALLARPGATRAQQLLRAWNTAERLRSLVLCP